MRIFREIKDEERELLMPKLKELEEKIGDKCHLIEGSASDEENGVTIFNYEADKFHGPETFILGIYNGKVYESTELGLDLELKQWGCNLTGEKRC